MKVPIKSPYYLGKENLRNAGAYIEMTAHQQKEYLRCARDPYYFIENYVYIISLDEGKIKFKLRDYQKDIIEACQDNRFVIAKIARQMGKTQTIAALILWYVLFHEDFKVCVLAHKKSQAQEILDRIQMSYEMLPLWLQQGVKTWNKGNIELENGSKVDSEATSEGAIRGRSYNVVYLDEFAHVDAVVQENFFTSTYPVITSGKTTKIFLTSTPNGLEYFYKIWTDSENNKNSYKRVECDWSAMPGRDESWKIETIRNTSERQFAQEFDCEFYGSSATLIDGRKLRSIPYHDPINKEDFVNNINKDMVAVFEKPIKDHKYVMTVDSSEAKEKDYSAFVIFDVTAAPYKVVARFRSNSIPIMVYPTKVEELARIYNDAWILVETNSVGHSVAHELKVVLGYENMFHIDFRGRGGQQLANHGTVGLKTSKATKQTGCQYLKNLVETDQLILNDFDIWTELSTFIMKPNGTFAADSGKHDDLVSCLFLFSWLVKQEYFKVIFEVDISEAVLEVEQEQYAQDLQPFNVMVGLGHGGSVESFFYNGEYSYDDELFGKW